jgi:hypothetical protein
MELERYVDRLGEQLGVVAAAGGDETRALAERLVAPLEAALRLMLLDVLGAAAAEITRELAPGSVELRLRGGEPEFVVSAPALPEAADGVEEPPEGPWRAAAAAGGEGGLSRVNLRLPDELKSRVEQAAEREGLSVNAWLVRAASAAVDRAAPGASPAPGGARAGQRYTGWGR